MASSTLTDPYLLFAFWTGTAALALTLLLGAQIVWLRMALRRRQRREKTVIAKWRPLLHAALAGESPAALPALARNEQVVFLKLWIHLHQSMRGEASLALNAFGRRLHCDAIARRLLKSGNRAQRLLAILALGHLGDRAAWPQLLQQATSADSLASVKALWALLQIDPEAAARNLMATAIGRDDWSLAALASVLQEAPDASAAALVAALPGIDAGHLPRALQLAEALRTELPAGMLAGLLGHASVEVVTGALRLAATPEVLGPVRENAAHPDWRVRVQAARALGRIGDRSDLERLRVLLHDAQWWVRYRAAQSLGTLPFLGAAELQALRHGLTDRYAGDILGQVLVEKGIA